MSDCLFGATLERVLMAACEPWRTDGAGSALVPYPPVLELRLVARRFDAAVQRLLAPHTRTFFLGCHSDIHYLEALAATLSHAPALVERARLSLNVGDSTLLARLADFLSAHASHATVLRTVQRITVVYDDDDISASVSLAFTQRWRAIAAAYSLVRAHAPATPLHLSLKGLSLGRASVRVGIALFRGGDRNMLSDFNAVNLSNSHGAGAGTGALKLARALRACPLLICHGWSDEDLAPLRVQMGARLVGGGRELFTALLGNYDTPAETDPTVAIAAVAQRSDCAEARYVPGAGGPKYTFLHAAVWSSQPELVRRLLARRVGANLELPVRRVGTPLALAVGEYVGAAAAGGLKDRARCRRLLDIVALLLAAGASPCTRDHMGQTPFLTALACPDATVMEMLLRGGGGGGGWSFDALARCPYGQTPLHEAAGHGRLWALEFVLAHGSKDVEIASNCGSTPLNAANSGGLAYAGPPRNDAVACALLLYARGARLRCPPAAHGPTLLPGFCTHVAWLPLLRTALADDPALVTDHERISRERDGGCGGDSLLWHALVCCDGAGGGGTDPGPVTELLQLLLAHGASLPRFCAHQAREAHVAVAPARARMRARVLAALEFGF